MPSPFPGMNPYLERESVWESFRVSLTVGIQGQLAGQLAARYVVRIATRVYTHEPTAEERRRGDAVDNEKLRYITVHDGNDLVTVIELLSLTNKNTGPHRDRYSRERNESLRSLAHFVELDLLRGGPRMLDRLPDCDYCALVSRAEERPRMHFWPWRLPDPIPLIPIPLRLGDADATLDLKAAIDQMYDGGRYAKYIYTGPPEPRLAPDDAAWAATFLPPAS